MLTKEQMEIENKIILDKDFFGEAGYLTKYKSKSLLVYSLIMKHFISSRNISIFSLNMILDYTGVQNTNTYALYQIKDILTNFEKDNFFTYNKEPKGDSLIIAKLKKELDNYILVYDFEMDTIYNHKLDKNIDRDKLYSVFCFIKSCINNETKVCYPTFETIKENTKIKSDNSLTQYLKVLKDDMELILYENIGLKVFKDKTIAQAGNIYAMNYQGSEHCLNLKLQEYKQELESKNIKIVNKEEVNNKRSESMKKYWEKVREMGN